MERVRVAKPTSIELADVSSLPEGNRLEYYAAKQFLEIFNRDRQVPYEIDLLQDCPDVACTPAPFYIEVATFFDTPTDAPKLFRRGEGDGGVREIHAAIQQVNGILRDRASKRYGVVNCILGIGMEFLFSVVETFVALWMSLLFPKLTASTRFIS